ncbi:MAG: DUF3137 domain-containing protein [Bacteroidota bacterium]
MQRLNEFRIFYNQTIHPELLRMERRRRRLLLLFAFTFVLLLAFFFLARFFNVPTITFFLLIPFGFYLTYLGYKIQQFVAMFKPNVVNLILDFIDDGLNFGTLTYNSKQFIPKKEFQRSRIFGSAAHYYNGEDYISGKIGELDFELCELKVRELSRVRNRYNYVFRGIFMKATFNRPLQGSIIILPKKFKQYLTRSIKSFTGIGGQLLEAEIVDPRFDELFLTYATPDASPESILSDDMQRAIAAYRDRYDKEIYVSFINKDIYVGVTEPKDILEPFIFSSNVSFDLVREFFEDIQLLISIVQDFDQHD